MKLLTYNKACRDAYKRCLVLSRDYIVIHRPDGKVMFARKCF